MTEIARYYCPACSRQIESDLNTARAGVKCPDCQVGFVPETFETVTESELAGASGVVIPPRSYAEHLAHTAAGFIRFAVWFLVAAPFLGLLVNALLDTAESAKIIIWASMAGGCISVAVVLSVLGNLIHIRALLAKQME